MSTRGKITVVVGGQWGSEAKGLAVERLIQIQRFAYAVRTGAINAGHTVYKDGKKFVVCQLPSAWVNEEVKLVLGAGSYIEENVLQQEISFVNENSKVKTGDRLLIDSRAYAHTREMTDKEERIGIHERMGSTGHGCGEAIKSKIDRLNHAGLFSHSKYAKDGDLTDFVITDTTTRLIDALERGENVLVEGTQGTLLDLHYGVEYPYTTSRQTIASAWLAESGLPPKNVEVVAVLRAFPIRVAGNSGPFPGELSWHSLITTMNTRRSNAGLPPIVHPDVLAALLDAEQKAVLSLGIGKLPYDMQTYERERHADALSKFHGEVFRLLTPQQADELRTIMEFTTVTKKVRRIGQMDEETLALMTRLNAPDSIFLNFLNYKFPETWGITAWDQISNLLREEIKQYLGRIEKITKCPVLNVSTSATTVLSTQGL